MTETANHKKPTSDHARRKLVRFLLFSVCVALVPILFRCLPSPSGQPSRSLADAVAHGELLLVGVAAAATALGEVLGTGREHDLRHLLGGGTCVLVIIAASLYFAGIPTASPIDSSAVFNVSGVVFTLAMAASTYTIKVSEVVE